MKRDRLGPSEGRAICPLCGRGVPTFIHGSRVIYVHHNRTGKPTTADVCDASGWLVEDDEVERDPRGMDRLEATA